MKARGESEADQNTRSIRREVRDVGGPAADRSLMKLVGRADGQGEEDDDREMRDESAATPAEGRECAEQSIHPEVPDLVDLERHIRGRNAVQAADAQDTGGPDDRRQVWDELTQA